MTPVDLLVAAPLIAFLTFLWASMQTEVVNGKGYKKQGSDLWIEKTVKVKKPKYPNIGEPVIPSDKD
jgi:hypothetical protein